MKFNDKYGILQMRLILRTHSFNETHTISGALDEMLFVGLFEFFVAETECNRRPCPCPQQRSLAHAVISVHCDEASKPGKILQQTQYFCLMTMCKRT